ncbi:MAG: hypothetical protein AVDCRST_MAG43-658 [uncultured Thermomicrobiales bacterium]|uniref:Uncharacterized protein n=1 Tax=uncultured Thermomicrobiales bacterium TaxID=1645740 RepID=A0A6J4UCP8_9BACT|nr:MAG: hypothetical protein AVDCRST_MAG43-658 [uncultured Thermomicrobiales bacterium]
MIYASDLFMTMRRDRVRSSDRALSWRKAGSSYGAWLMKVGER